MCIHVHVCVYTSLNICTCTLHVMILCIQRPSNMNMSNIPILVLSSGHYSKSQEESNSQPEDIEVTLSALAKSGLCNVIMY